jgi:hypothetical protein
MAPPGGPAVPIDVQPFVEGVNLAAPEAKTPEAGNAAQAAAPPGGPEAPAGVRGEGEKRKHVPELADLEAQFAALMGDQALKVEGGLDAEDAALAARLAALSNDVASAEKPAALPQQARIEPYVELPKNLEQPIVVKASEEERKTEEKADVVVDAAQEEAAIQAEDQAAPNPELEARLASLRHEQVQAVPAPEAVPTTPTPPELEEVDPNFASGYSPPEPNDFSAIRQQAWVDAAKAPTAQPQPADLKTPEPPAPAATQLQPAAPAPTTPPAPTPKISLQDFINKQPQLVKFAPKSPKPEGIVCKTHTWLIEAERKIQQRAAEQHAQQKLAEEAKQPGMAGPQPPT